MDKRSMELLERLWGRGQKTMLGFLIVKVSLFISLSAERQKLFDGYDFTVHGLEKVSETVF
jgi:hypothetical protein